MPIGTTDQAVFGYWKQTAYGTDPAATTAEQLLRLTGESLSTNLTMAESQEITGSRNLAGLFNTDGESGGNLNFQLSYGDLDELLAGAFGGATAWAANVLKNGTTITGFAFQKKVADVTTPFWIKYPNAVIDTMSLSLTPGQLVTGSLGIKAGIATTTTASMSSVAATAVSTNPVYSSVVDITGLTEGGSGITQVGSLNINTTNNFRLIKTVGTLGPSAVALGQFRCSGTIDAYVQDKSLLDKFLAKTSSSLAVQIGTGANKKYAISIPKIQYTSAEVTAGSISSDFVARLGWTAYYDSGITATIQITRTP